MKTLTAETLGGLCLESAGRYGDRPALRLFSEGKICRQISYRMLGQKARQFGLLLAQLGVAPGDRVLLFSENCPEWPVAYFGISLAGAVSVPLLTGFSTYQVENIAAQAEVKAVILNSEMLEKIGALASKLPLVFLDKLEEMTASIKPDAEDGLGQGKGEDLATIIYTSGTSGNSKGVMLSNMNLISNAVSVVPLAKMKVGDRFLSVLPLAHSYECTLGMLAPLVAGSNICYLDRPPSPSILLPAAKAVRPTMMAAVPVLIEKMYRNGVAPKLAKNPLYRFLLTRPLAIRVAGRKMKAALGGKIRFFGLGGAPLSNEVERFLRRARFPFAIGYGLTEAAPLVAGDMFQRFPFRSTGTALRGVEVRISVNVKANGSANGSAANGTAGYGSIGEIQVRGPNVMMGYYRNEEQTREVFTADGWLKTGDLGSIDKRGNIFVRGRSKALILGPSGENIYPEEIEGLLNTSEIVEEALVYSNAQGELVAMVRLTDAAKAAMSAVEQALEELRAWANKKLASFSRLSKIEIRYEPFEKTPTMKIKRYLYA